MHFIDGPVRGSPIVRGDVQGDLVEIGLRLRRDDVRSQEQVDERLASLSFDRR